MNVSQHFVMQNGMKNKCMLSRAECFQNVCVLRAKNWTNCNAQNKKIIVNL